MVWCCVFVHECKLSIFSLRRTRNVMLLCNSARVSIKIICLFDRKRLNIKKQYEQKPNMLNDVKCCPSIVILQRTLNPEKWQWASPLWYWALHLAFLPSRTHCPHHQRGGSQCQGLHSIRGFDLASVSAQDLCHRCFDRGSDSTVPVALPRCLNAWCQLLERVLVGQCQRRRTIVLAARGPLSQCPGWQLLVSTGIREYPHHQPTVPEQQPNSTEPQRPRASNQPGAQRSHFLVGLLLTWPAQALEPTNSLIRKTWSCKASGSKRLDEFRSPLPQPGSSQSLAHQRCHRNSAFPPARQRLCWGKRQSPTARCHYAKQPYQHCRLEMSGNDMGWWWGVHKVPKF